MRDGDLDRVRALPLFAGCSTGRIADTTRLTLAPRREARRHTRLDMEYVSALTAAVSASPDVRAGLRYTANDSLYEAAGRLRYTAGRIAPGEVVGIDG